MPKSASSWRVHEALTSVRRLAEVVREMTHEELARAIALEEETLRRKNILERLYRQARVLARETSQDQLTQSIKKEK